jgi:hypothetical protein
LLAPEGEDDPAPDPKKPAAKAERTYETIGQREAREAAARAAAAAAAHEDEPEGDEPEGDLFDADAF